MVIFFAKQSTPYTYFACCLPLSETIAEPNSRANSAVASAYPCAHVGAIAGADASANLYSYTGITYSRLLLSIRPNVYRC